MVEEIRVNGSSEPFAARTVAELLAARRIAEARGVAVAVNGEVVPSGRWAERMLAPGDEVEIVRPFQGG